jgi:hypothetical protein
MKLLLYFTFTAHYIVAAMSYMRSDQVWDTCEVIDWLSFWNLFSLSVADDLFLPFSIQLSGGTNVDTGRIW